MKNIFLVLFLLSRSLLAISQDDLETINNKCDRLFRNCGESENLVQNVGTFRVNYIFTGFKIYEKKKLVLWIDNTNYGVYSTIFNRNIEVCEYVKNGWEKRFEKEYKKNIILTMPAMIEKNIKLGYFTWDRKIEWVVGGLNYWTEKEVADVKANIEKWF